MYVYIEGIVVFCICTVVNVVYILYVLTRYLLHIIGVIGYNEMGYIPTENNTKKDIVGIKTTKKQKYEKK